MGAEETTANEPTTPEGQDIESLPDWAQKLIHSLRDENAAARVKNKEITDALTEAQGAAKLAGDNASQFEDQLKAERFARTRDRLAWERGIPTDLAASLNADSEETLTKALDALAAFKGSTPSGDGPAPSEPEHHPTNPLQEGEQEDNPTSEREAIAEAFFANLDN